MSGSYNPMTPLNSPLFDISKAVVWYGYGGTDICGEWQWNGNDYANISKGEFGNQYPYHIDLFALRGRGWKPRSYRIVVTIKMAGLHLSVGEADKLKNRKQAFAKMTEVIREFEVSNRFAEEMWPKITHPKRRKDIVKRMQDGSYRWVASTYTSDMEILQGTRRRNGSFPLGTGQFYVRSWSLDEYSSHDARGTEDWREVWNINDIRSMSVTSMFVKERELPKDVIVVLEDTAS